MILYCVMEADKTINRKAEIIKTLLNLDPAQQRYFHQQNIPVFLLGYPPVFFIPLFFQICSASHGQSSG